MGKETTSDDITIPTFKGEQIPDYTRRKTWSALELGFLRDNYQTKKITWIARQLRRRPSQVYQRLARMYAEGLPEKQPRNGRVEM